jgi:hypothetical protein
MDLWFQQSGISQYPHETILDTSRPTGSSQHSPKQVPHLDHKCVSSQRWKMKSHGSMDQHFHHLRWPWVPPLHTHIRDRGKGPQARELAPPISGGSSDTIVVASRAHFHSTDLGSILEEQTGPIGQWMGSLDPLPMSIQVGWHSTNSCTLPTWWFIQGIHPKVVGRSVYPRVEVERHTDRWRGGGVPSTPPPPKNTPIGPHLREFILGRKTT